MGINNIVIQGTITYLRKANDNLVIGTLTYDGIGNNREHKVILEFWRNNVPLPAESFGRSKKVLITGRLETSKYRNNQGKRREKTYINVTSYQILGNGVGQLTTGEITEEPTEPETTFIVTEAELPF